MEKTVLIVEDERAIVEILKFNLKREGYQTLEALDGETGLALARSGDPDLILLDVMLPRMNGFDICAALRREGSTVPIIMPAAQAAVIVPEGTKLTAVYADRGEDTLSAGWKS